ncbi:putative phospholipid-binding lipoprotein MlaA precursor [Variovorax sp. PBS-H4]|uniref:MlaA family lipoprotein n=1 Tax=Variovorax sp. PBS-H4 TaxID=434008 RepID=UPI00131702B6|nr:VacJ family lipoprotein [Variovorax sp. PBS-H4]VTU24030.1 putative phospholipid-binding lipoprotein MlaA precursor [Variovorax sp. PBS-H4]
MKTRSPLDLPCLPRGTASAVRCLGAVAALAIATGCASGPKANPADPFEPFNRGVTRFNDVVDDAVLVPAATAYRRVLPSFVRTGVNNFFGNLSDVWSFANSVLQLKLQNSAQTFMRVNVNTVFGLGGLLDIATEAGIDRHSEDFGQTLGRWGVPSGPYVVLPLLGSSTVRDTAALTIDRQGDLLNQINDIPWRNSLYFVRVIDARSNFLRASQLIDDAALDKYTFTRDAYLQRRHNEVHDGDLPNEGN